MQGPVTGGIEGSEDQRDGYPKGIHHPAELSPKGAPIGNPYTIGAYYPQGLPPSLPTLLFSRGRPPAPVLTLGPLLLPLGRRGSVRAAVPALAPLKRLPAAEFTRCLATLAGARDTGQR